MTKFGYVLALTLFLAGLLHSQGGQSFQHEQNNDRHRWKWDDNGKVLEITAKGEFEFNEDYSNITKLSDRGYIKIDDRRQKPKRWLEVRPDAAGNLTREYFVGNVEHPFDAEAQKWLSSTLLDLVRQTGFDAPRRVARIHEKQGVQGVLNEVELLEGDFVRRIYIENLIKIASLDLPAWERVLNLVRNEFSSDYEKTQVLRQVAGRLPEEESVTLAFIEATASISSDYEKGRAFNEFISSKKPSGDALRKTLQATAKINSDYERAKLLTHMLKELPAQTPLPEEFFANVSAMSSDYEKNRVLREVVSRRNSDASTLARAVKQIERFASDYEKAQFITQLAKNDPPLDAIAPSVFAVIRKIGSDFEKRRALNAFSQWDRLSKENVKLLLQAIESINSDFEKASTLIQVSEHLRNKDDYQDELIDVAMSIQSDHERGRALAKLFKNGGRREKKAVRLEADK